MAMVEEVQKVESPIELDLFWAMFNELVEAEMAGTIGRWYIRCQHTLGPFRFDFVVTVSKPHDATTWHHLLVEADGHDFHERTKEQAARDRARDRAAQRNGFKIFRFTGSEIFRDRGACAREVLAEFAAWMGG